MKNGTLHYQEEKCTLKSEEYTQFPHLFHGPLDNEPLPACFEASEASPMLNKAEGLWRWLMPGNKPNMPDTHYQEAFAA